MSYPDVVPSGTQAFEPVNLDHLLQVNAAIPLP